MPAVCEVLPSLDSGLGFHPRHERLDRSPEELADVNPVRSSWPRRSGREERRGDADPHLRHPGPRGDAYEAGEEMDADAAEAYHAEQLGTFAATEAEICALPMQEVWRNSFGISGVTASIG